MYAIEEDEEEDYEGEYVQAEVSFDQDEMDEYYRQFTEFMQVELHKKYELRSRRDLECKIMQVKKKVPFFLQW